MKDDKAILIRQPTILGPNGQPIKQMNHPMIEARKAAAAATAPTKDEIASARTQAASMGFRIVKQSAAIRKGNIRRAKKANLRGTLKGTGKSFADHYAETRDRVPGSQAQIKIERQKRREEREHERSN